ncbi:Arabinose operon regulatory protein [Rubripirellula tenax]|uniref:Arabinose operon regulatory protein n=1 Tax=Rubripirellula tenax TaxID=2528015 RepID=A0A5C6FL28_9BACT|nr:AraC family transcriptional regulator [Rubripirellula tenax]TWU60707.1 Arabinose operon regulatory protein [Rubripirellula tenax]
MDTEKLQLRANFFASLDDPATLMRLLDFLPNVYAYAKNSNGQFVAGNRSWLKMRGFTSVDEVTGKTDRELHPLYWALQYQEEDRRVIDSGCELAEQVWLVPSGDGKLSTFISTKIPLRDKSGAVIGIAGVMYSTDNNDASTGQPDPIGRATTLIARRYGGPLSVAEIAKAVGLSSSQLNRRFRTKFQIPPSEYLQRVRIHQASRLLTETDAPISEVALDTGFFDQAHLTRTFRRWMGMTPTEFRRSVK